MGPILLAGGKEFSGDMCHADLRAIALAGGLSCAIRIIPAAAAPDNNHLRAGQNGCRWFLSLGASDVAVVPLIDRQSAADPQIEKVLRGADLIYLLGGFPRYLAQTLAGSRAWQAITTANAAGSVVAGSSAGAMVLCDWYWNPETEQLHKGLGLVPDLCIIPHHQEYGPGWSVRIRSLLTPGVLLLGIDEATAVIRENPQGRWRVWGCGKASRYIQGCPVDTAAGGYLTMG